MSAEERLFLGQKIEGEFLIHSDQTAKTKANEDHLSQVL